MFLMSYDLRNLAVGLDCVTCHTGGFRSQRAALKTGQVGSGRIRVGSKGSIQRPACF